MLTTFLGHWDRSISGLDLTIPPVQLLGSTSIPRAVQTDAYLKERSYWETNKETLKQIVIDAGGSFSGDVATYTGVPPAGQSNAEGVAAVNAWNSNIAVMKSIANGQLATNLIKITASIYTDYAFSAGVLKGLRVGGGVNYRGRRVIGNRAADTMRSLTNPNVAVDDPSVGPFDYVYSDPYAISTVTLKYTLQLRKKYELSFDLKVGNALNYDRPGYYSVVLRPKNGDLSNPARVTTPAAFGSPTLPRDFLLSSTLKF